VCRKRKPSHAPKKLPVALEKAMQLFRWMLSQTRGVNAYCTPGGRRILWLNTRAGLRCSSDGQKPLPSMHGHGAAVTCIKAHSKPQHAPRWAAAIGAWQDKAHKAD